MSRTESSPIGKNRIITHRGLEPFNPNFPFAESTYEAFENQLARGFGGLEFDPNPTKDGIVILHDPTLERATGGRDKRPVAEITTLDATSAVFTGKGRIATFQELMDLIRKHDAKMNSLHLKYRFQTPEMLERIMDALEPNQDIFDKLIVFDVKLQTARTLKQHFPTLRLAPSVAHPHDIARYNQAVGGTLLTLEETLKLREEGLIDGIWGDEWDTQGINNTKKILYTPDFFEKVHEAGLFAALVTPELHGTSPHLLGGESHEDAKETTTLMERIEEIKEAGADYFCTDHPEEVAAL